MREVLEDLLTEVSARIDESGIWAEGLLLEGYTLAMTEVQKLLEEQIQIEKLGE